MRVSAISAPRYEQLRQELDGRLAHVNAQITEIYDKDESVNPSNSVAGQTDFPPGLRKRFLYGFIQLLPYQEVRTLCVEPYARKEGSVSNSRQPLMQWRPVSIRAKKSRYQNHSGTVTVRDSPTVI